MDDLSTRNYVVVLGDLNARVGDGEVEGVVGKCGVPGENESGERLLDMCVEQELVIGNSFFKKKEINKYTDSDAAVKQLQEDLRKVGEWSKKWQMPFNLDKCKIMHIGHKNKNEKYEILGKEIESVQQEKDLGVVITNDLKSSNQCIEAVKKA